VQNELVAGKAGLASMYNIQVDCGKSLDVARQIAKENAKSTEPKGCCLSTKLEKLQVDSMTKDKESLTLEQQGQRRFFGAVRFLSSDPRIVVLLSEASTILYHHLGKLPSGVFFDATGNLVKDLEGLDLVTGELRKKRVFVYILSVRSPCAEVEALRKFNRPPIAIATIATSDQSSRAVQIFLNELKTAEALAFGSNLLSLTFHIDCCDMMAKAILKVMNLETMDSYNTRRVQEVSDLQV
jgi:hypothetical protein